MNTSSVPADQAARAKRRVLVAASLVTALSMFDSNIVAVSLPSIARTLGASFADIEWVISAYMLSFAALLLGAGSYADRHGRKRATLIGLVIFAVASGLCGLAQSALMLDLARALQGIGASLLVPSGLAIINHAFAARERAKAYAFWGACLGVALTSGPIVGGVVTDLCGWRWAFLINLPICIALFMAIAAFVQESSDHEAKRLDYAGILTFTAGLFLLIWALIDGNALGWAAQPIVERFAGAAVLLVAFLFVELVQKRPMVDFTLFAQPTFLGSVFAMLGYAAGAQVLIFYLPLFLQNAFDLSPAMAGLAMLPFALPMFLTPFLAAGLARRYSGRLLLTGGLMTALIGDLLLWTLAQFSLPYPALLLGMLVAGAAAGLLNSETAKVMQGAVPAQRAGMAGGLTGTTRFVGLLVGIAAFGAVLAHVASRSFIARGVAAGLDPGTASELSKHVTSGDVGGIVGTVPEALRTSIWHIGNAAFADGFAAALLLAAAIAAAMALLTLLLVRRAETLPVTGGGNHLPASEIRQSRPTSMEGTMQAQSRESHHGVHGRAGVTAYAFSRTTPRLPGVEAGLSYLAPTAERPFNYMYEPPAGIAQQNCDYRLRPVWIADARAMASPPSIHGEGFELWDAPTSVEDFGDEDAIRTRYYGEAAELAKCVTGADHAFIFDHQLRQREAGRPALTLGRRGDGSRPGAAGRIHCDYSEASGQKRFENLPLEPAVRSKAHRFAIINIWRSIGGKIVDTPLAVCDARSISVRDLVVSDLHYRDRSGEMYLVQESPHHRWAYFSEMDRREALVFKQYDSQVSGVARFTPHSAFDLPDIPPGAPLRRSIEIRCLVTYG